MFLKRLVAVAMLSLALAGGSLAVPGVADTAEASSRCWYHKAHYWHGKWVRSHWHCGQRYKARSHRSYSYGGSSKWDRIARCESGGDWHNADTGRNGHYGGLQFSPESWRAAGGRGMPHHASKAEQIRRAEILLRMQGWGAWTCAHAR